MNQIIQNEAKCLKCNDIIWSAHRHDFKQCSCGAIFVDGGMDYIRRGGNLEAIEERSLSTDVDELTSCVKCVAETIKQKADNLEIALPVLISYGIKKDGELNLSEKVLSECVEAVEWGKETGRNPFGIVLAVIRALRDNNCLNMEKFNA